MSEPQPKNEWLPRTPRSEQACGNCDYCKPMNAVVGECHGTTPTAVLVGVQQRQPSVIGQAPPPPEPVVHGYFPPVLMSWWCCRWKQKVDGEG